MDTWIFYTSKIEHKLATAFGRYGSYVSRRPLIPIVLSVLICGATSIGILYMEEEVDPNVLFTPKNSRAWSDKRTYEDVFEGVQDPSRGSGLIGFVARDGNVWTESRLQYMLDVYEQVKDIELEQNDKRYTYEDICLKSLETNKCSVVSPLAFVEYNSSLLASRDLDTLVAFPFAYDPLQAQTIYVPFLLSRVQTENISGVVYVKSAEAASMIFKTDRNHFNTYPWEREFVKYMDSREQPPDGLETVFSTASSIAAELSASINADVTKFIAAFAFMMTFAVLVLSRLDCVTNMSLLGITGVLSSTMSVVSALGLVGGLGLKYNALVQICPFLLIGLGVDDMFVMVRAYQTTSKTLSPDMRMRMTFENAGISIFLTSLTDFLAFTVGSTSVFHSVQSFCIYTGVGVMFDFFYQVTFFAGFMVLNARREAKGQNCCNYRGVCTSTNSCYLQCCCCCEHPDDKPELSLVHVVAPLPSEEEESGKQNATSSWTFKEWYGENLMKPFVKVGVLLVFAVYLSVAVYGMLGLKQGQDMKELAPRGSYLSNFYKVETEYFSDLGPQFWVTTQDIEYWDPDVQEAIQNMVNDMDASEWVISGNAINWLSDFLQFSAALHINITTEEQFVEALYESFLAERSPFSFYKYKIAFNDIKNPTHLKGSKFGIPIISLDGNERRSESMVDMRRIVDNHAQNISPDLLEGTFVYYGGFPQMESDQMVVSATLKNLSLACLAMFCVTLVIIPHPVVSLFVILVIIMIDVGVVGYMGFWGLRLDVVTMINLIIGIGFSVDFSAHICHSFMISTVGNRNERAVDALDKMGIPILQGGLSTLLAVIVLVNSDSNIFQAFFKMIFLIMFLGISHGLIFLPVLLSLIGPKSHRSPKTQIAQKNIVKAKQKNVKRKSSKRSQTELDAMLVDTEHSINI